MHLILFLLLTAPLSGALSLQHRQHQPPPLPPGQSYKSENIATPARIAAAHNRLAAFFSPPYSSSIATNANTNISLARGLHGDDDQTPEVYCDGSGQGLGYWDFRYASEIAQAWCDGGGRAAPRTHVYADYGSARVALCNFGSGRDGDGEEVGCSSGEIEAAWAGIDEKCPIGRDALSKRGQWVQPDGKKGFNRDDCNNGNVCVSVFDVPCSENSPSLDKGVA